MAKSTSVTQTAGFTLIEVMITVAVIGILAAIALPNYQEHLLRAKLVDAGSGLSQLRVALEQYYQDNRNYDVKPDEPIGTCGIEELGSDGKYSINFPSDYFSFTCTTSAPGSDTGQVFTLTATGKADGATAAFAYTIDQRNNRKTTALPSAWGSPASCWITAKGQTCN